jgi:multiple sugar transport system substrate-binding protein
MKMNLTDPKIKQVTEYWDKLYQAGAISHDADFNDAWYQGFAKGKYAGWLSAAWGPIFLQDYTKSSKGEWRAQPLPQWQEGQNVSGNWGGSTLAVIKQSKYPAAAAEFARWILNEREPVEMFSFDRFLFPVQNFMLNNDEWLTKPYDFYGGQEVNKVYSAISATVDKGWEWNPIHEYVNTQGNAIKAKSIDQGKGATAALQPWQDAVVNYAEQQGITVAGQ